MRYFICILAVVFTMVSCKAELSKEADDSSRKQENASEIESKDSKTSAKKLEYVEDKASDRDNDDTIDSTESASASQSSTDSEKLQTEDESIGSSDDSEDLADTKPTNDQPSDDDELDDEPSDQKALKLQSEDAAGEFLLKIEESQRFGPELSSRLKSQKLLEQSIKFINSSYGMPNDIPVYFRDCNSVGAYWNRIDQEIVLCYEFLSMITAFFTGAGKSDAFEQMVNVATFVLFHEIGHAYIDVLRLPTVGPEEDVVDEFSSVLLLSAGKGRLDQILLSTAHYFRHCLTNRSI